jgi:hypothetical protein
MRIVMDPEKSTNLPIGHLNIETRLAVDPIRAIRRTYPMFSASAKKGREGRGLSKEVWDDQVGSMDLKPISYINLKRIRAFNRRKTR